MSPEFFNGFFWLFVLGFAGFCMILADWQTERQIRKFKEEQERNFWRAVRKYLGRPKCDK